MDNNGTVNDRHIMELALLSVIVFTINWMIDDINIHDCISNHFSLFQSRKTSENSSGNPSSIMILHMNPMGVSCPTETNPN